MRKPRLSAEEIFTVLALMLYSGGPLYVLLSPGDTAGDEPDFAIVRLIFLFTYVIFAWFLFLRWKRVIYLLIREKFILLIVGIALLSFLWSDVPSATINRGIALLGTTFFGIYLATRYSPPKQLRLLGWAFGLVVVLSLLFAIALPRYGIMSGTHDGAWRGIYTHKNVLGKVMVLSNMAFLLRLMSSKKGRFPLRTGLGCSFLLLILSASKTSLVVLITLLMSVLPIRAIRLRDIVLIPVFLTLISVVTGAAVLLTLNATTIILALGKDPTLTGRTDLWMYSLKMLEERIFLGYGYYGFWQGWDSSAAYVWRAIGWTAPHAHNGLIDLGLDLGLLGIFIFLAGFLKNLARSLSYVRLTRTPEGFWPLLYLELMVLVNLTESTLLVRNSIFWVLYVAVALTISAPLEEGTTVEITDK